MTLPNNMPCLGYVTDSIEEINRMGWLTGLSLTAYGCRIGIRSNDPAVMDRLPAYLPPGWEQSEEPTVDRLYSIFVRTKQNMTDRDTGENEAEETETKYILYCDGKRVATRRILHHCLYRMEFHLQLWVAVHATDQIFVHAGVVAWNGKAILIPARSNSGKSVLVSSLIEAGATYYSDEFAVIDGDGRIWPYPRCLSFRDDSGYFEQKIPPAELGAKVGQSPLPVGLIVLTAYDPDAHWAPRDVPPGRATLALLSRAMGARKRPKAALDRLQKVVTNARTIESDRGKASDVVDQILGHLS